MHSRPTALVLAVVLLALFAGSARADDQPTPAAQTLSQCVQTNGSLSALVLMDESGSLNSTDPQNRRVEGLRAALAGLGRLASTSVDGKRPRVDVLLVGFSGTVDPDPNAKNAHPDWQSLTPAGIDALIARAGGFAARNKGHSTDYKTALLAARQLLAQHAGQLTASGGTAPCKALIWFTDGRYDIPGGQSAITDGTQFLCRSNGLMDGIASDQIVKFVVGLSLDPSGRGFLQSLTDSTTTPCGTQLSPRTGAYFDVSDSAKLFFAFGGLLDGDGDPLPPRPVCPGAPCTRGATSFSLVPGLRGFLIRAVTDAPAINAVLRGPSGQEFTLTPRATDAGTVDGAAIAQRWVSDEAVEIQGDLPPGTTSWSGNWSLTFVDAAAQHPSAVPIGRIQLLADAAAAVVGEPPVVKGAPTNLVLRLVRSDGSAAPETPVAKTATVTVTLTNPTDNKPTSLPVTPHSGFGSFTATAALRADSSAPYVLVDTETTFAPVAGHAVTPERRSFKLITRLPAGQGYPEVSPTDLRPGSIRGKGSTSATLTVTASPDSGGCVWVGDAMTTSDPPVAMTSAPATSSSAAGCLHLKAGESRELHLTFKVHKASSSTARVQIPVGLRSDLTRGDRQVTIPATFQLYPPPNVGKRIAIIVLLTLLGLLLPLGLLWLLNYWGARLTAPQLLRTVSQEVRLTPGAELIASDGSPPVTRYRDLEPLSNEGVPNRPRTLPVGDFHIRAVAARSLRDLFSGPYATATANGKPLLVGSTTDVKQDDNPTRKRVPLALAGTWLFLPTDVKAVDDQDHGLGYTIVGRLTTIIADGADIDDGTRLVADAAARLDTHDWGSSTPEPSALSVGERLKARVTRRASNDGAPDDREDAGATAPLRKPDKIGDDPHDY